MAIVTLRPFQQQLRNDIHAAWNSGATNVMPVAATGSGKTVILSAELLDEPGASAALAHRQELVSQISVALARNGVTHRILGNNQNLIRAISAMHMFELGNSYMNPNAKTGVGGVDTIIRMSASDPWFKQVRLQVQDEAHHVLRENKWGKVAAMFPNARGLFPTATPIRADGKGLGRHADGLVDSMVLAPSMRDIINMGFLTDYRIFAPPSAVDLTQVDISSATGDFNADQVRKAVHKAQITGDVVDTYIKHAMGKLGVTFAVDVEAANEIAAAFNLKGVRAEVVSAKTPDTLRTHILAQFKRREILQLVNVDLFGEGFDLPAIEVVSFARPTQSFSLYSQQFGRALRLLLSAGESQGFNSMSDWQRLAVIAGSEKPVAMIFDHVGNVLRHGLPDAQRVWSLDARDRRGGSKVSDAIPLRTCMNPEVECYQTYERVLSCCPYCGHYPEPASRKGPEFVDGDILELDAATLAALRGERDKIDGKAAIPYGATNAIKGACERRHWEKQQAQYDLRNAIAWWAGLQSSQGRSESESYRRFYFKFGIDVANAQILKKQEADELAARVMGELSKFGIDGSINAATYFIPK